MDGCFKTYINQLHRYRRKLKKQLSRLFLFVGFLTNYHFPWVCYRFDIMSRSSPIENSCQLIGDFFAKIEYLKNPRITSYEITDICTSLRNNIDIFISNTKLEENCSQFT